MEHIVNLLLGPAGLTIFVLLVIYGGWKRWWVFGWLYRDCVEEKNEWKKAALRGTRVAEKVASIHERNNNDV